ncbi:MAG: 16S rRNA (guanine(527)-N(7))-methyltransferase RsmG [Candidatus Babeliaceae bacterium]|nr:16S rRNA (guanine(527)-N(7))-methyltransferase RsmG [Candidatus Babeliaceae bacterium]
MEKKYILWQKFAEKNNLTEKQLTQFQRYYDLLTTSNKLFNITAITDIESVIAYHFQDSLSLQDFLDMRALTSLCDIGSGGGFPGIPLKIIFPHVNVLLLEVSQKKIEFLETVVDELGLENVEMCDLDWRTFLRKTEGQIDVFCARASLHPDELLRVFSGSSAYKDSTLVYWASQQWNASEKEKRFLKNTFEYCVGDRKRFYAIFKKS